MITFKEFYNTSEVFETGADFSAAESGKLLKTLKAKFKGNSDIIYVSRDKYSPGAYFLIFKVDMDKKSLEKLLKPYGIDTVFPYTEPYNR